MSFNRNVLQRMKVASGAQYTGILDLTSSAIGPKYPARRGCPLKEERTGQSGATYKTLLQQAAKHAYVPEKG